MQPTNNGSPETIQPTQNPVQNTGSSNKMIVWIVVILVLIILAAGGAYWYLNNKQTTQPVAVTETPTIAPTATPVSQDSLEKDLNAIDTEASASGLDSIDSDLKGL